MPEFPDPNDLNNWVNLAKYHKQLWVESTERGELTPTVFAERDGKVLCAVVSPQLDKMQGLHAAALLRKGLDADVITMLVDAHIYFGKPGQNQEEFMANRPKKRLQDMCDEDGACETGLISDCLVCHRINKKKIIQVATIPYSYHGKGTEFKWLNDPERFHEDIMDENNEGVVLDGDIPHAMRQIMDIPCFLDDPKIKMLTVKLDILEKDRQFYHTTRALFQALKADGFAVFDYVGHDKPWEDFQKSNVHAACGQ